MLEQLFTYVASLSQTYGVNYGVFLVLYLLSSLLCIYAFSVGIHRVRKKQPVRYVLLGFTASWIIPYVYVLFLGTNIPAWTVVGIVIITAIGVKEAQIRLEMRGIK